MQALGVFVPLCNGEGCRGERLRGGEKQYKRVTVGQSKGGKPAFEQKSVVGVSTVELLEM